MTARDQQDAAEEEEDDVGDDDLEINTPPDDAPEQGAESAYLDLSELAVELDFVVEHRDEDDNPETTKNPGRLLALLLVRHRRTAPARRTRWQRRRATTRRRRQMPSALGLGTWMTRRLWPARHGFFCKRLFILVICLRGRQTKHKSGGRTTNPRNSLISAFFILRV